MKRSGISRRTPMSRARLRAARLDPARSLEYAKAREAVLERSGGRCELCGVYLPLPAGHFHHRLRRSAGRSDCPSNGVWLCAGCHHLVHARISDALREGLLIGRHDRREPAEVPARLWVPSSYFPRLVADGEWFLLTADGGRVPLPEWEPRE